MEENDLLLRISCADLRESRLFTQKVNEQVFKVCNGAINKVANYK